MVGLIVLILVGILVFFLWDYMSATVEEKKEIILYKTSYPGRFIPFSDQDIPLSVDQYYFVTHSYEIKEEYYLFTRKFAGDPINFRIYKGKFTNFIYSIEAIY